MRTNHLNQKIVDENDFVDIIYQNQEPKQITVDQTDWVERFKRFCDLFEFETNIEWEIESNQTQDQYVSDCLADWNLPNEYLTFDLENYLIDKCQTQEQIDRVVTELKEYERRDMTIVLRFLKYFVETIERHGLFLGVGRGSSVASYVLFLIGIHRVDSLKYGLDINEFLR